MTALLLLDRDVAGHLAIALKRHRRALAKQGLVEPPGVAQLEAAALRVVNGNHEAATTAAVLEDDLDDRAFLTRQDVRRVTGASLSTVDRWLRAGMLPSAKRGRIVRIARKDLDVFLAA